MAQHRYSLALLVALAAPASAPADDKGFEALDPVAQRESAAIAHNVASTNGTQFNGANLNGTSFNGTSFNGTSVNGTSFNGTSFNGTSFNGTSFNGTSFNGTSFNGASLNGVSLNGVFQNGNVLNGTHLNGSELVGISSGLPVGGTDMVDTELQGQLSTGDSLGLRVVAARSAGGTWFYEISYATTSGDQPLCGLDGGGAPVEAIALAGRWDFRQGVSGGGAWIDDSSSISFGCRGAVLAKCVEMGYKPWASSGGTSLRDYHQACTRMMRADYCGDGTPHTVTGTPIDVYDGLGIQTDTASWNVEAEWTASGARFTTSSGDLRFRLLGGAAPSCLSSLASASTGNIAHFASGTLLMNEY